MLVSSRRPRTARREARTEYLAVSLEDNIAPTTDRPNVVFFTPAYTVANVMGGVGVRVWELAQALAAFADVLIVARGPFDLAAAGVAFVDASDEAATRAALETARTVVVYDLPDTGELLRLFHDGVTIISEVGPPIEHLEYHAVRSAPDADAAYADLVARYELQVLLTDHFLVQSDVARATLITSLCHLGRLTRANYDASAPLDHLISALPLGFSRAAAARARQASPTLPPIDFTWSGGLWDYYDPIAVVRAVAHLKQRGRPVRVRFLYPPPPDQVLKEAAGLREAIAAFGVERFVELRENPPGHADRDGALLSTRALVCVAKPGIENATCVRLRLRDTLLYSLPLVSDACGATATEVRALGIGLAVDCRDPAELAAAMETVARDDTARRQMIDRLRSVRERFVLDDYVQPVLDVVRERRHASDRGKAAHARRLTEMLARHADLWKRPVYPW